jgi:hypothetical protein
LYTGSKTLTTRLPNVLQALCPPHPGGSQQKSGQTPEHLPAFYPTTGTD